MATQEKGRGGEREKVNGGMEKVNEVNEVNGEFGESDGNGYLQKDLLLRISYIIMYARSYYYLFSDEMY